MPAHGIIGEEYGTQFPETVVPEQDLRAEKKAAQFSQTEEFKVLKEHLEQRIAFYQTYLPDGKAVTNLQTEMNMVELAQNWVIANTVIAEFKSVIDAYEQAAETVKEQSVTRGN